MLMHVNPQRFMYQQHPNLACVLLRLHHSNPKLQFTNTNPCFSNRKNGSGTHETKCSADILDFFSSKAQVPVVKIQFISTLFYQSLVIRMDMAKVAIHNADPPMGSLFIPIDN
jgi:hypothetical protein